VILEPLGSSASLDEEFSHRRPEKKRSVGGGEGGSISIGKASSERLPKNVYPFLSSRAAACVREVRRPKVATAGHSTSLAARSQLNTAAATRGDGFRMGKRSRVSKRGKCGGRSRIAAANWPDASFCK